MSVIHCTLYDLHDESLNGSVVLYLSRCPVLVQLLLLAGLGLGLWLGVRVVAGLNSF